MKTEKERLIEIASNALVLLVTICERGGESVAALRFAEAGAIVNAAAVEDPEINRHRQKILVIPPFAGIA